MSPIRLPLDPNGPDRLEIIVNGSVNPTVDFYLDGRTLTGGWPWRDFARGRALNLPDNSKLAVYMPSRFQANIFHAGEEGAAANAAVCFFCAQSPSDPKSAARIPVYLGLEKRLIPEPRCEECKSAHDKKSSSTTLAAVLSILIWLALFIGVMLIPGILDHFENVCVLVPSAVVLLFVFLLLGAKLGSSFGKRFLGDRKDLSQWSPSVWQMIIAGWEVGPLVEQDWRKTRGYVSTPPADSPVVIPQAVKASAGTGGPAVGTGAPGTIRCPDCGHDNPAWRSSCEKCSAVIRTGNLGVGNPSRPSTPSKNVQTGVLWIMGGITLSIITYAIAPSGGMYFVFWGPVVYGIYKILQGDR